MNKKSKNKIDKEKNIAEVLKENPEALDVFLTFGLHCAGCPASAFDTIEEGAKNHGLSDKEVEELVQRINELDEFGE